MGAVQADGRNERVLAGLDRIQYVAGGIRKRTDIVLRRGRPGDWKYDADGRRQGLAAAPYCNSTTWF